MRARRIFVLVREFQQIRIDLLTVKPRKLKFEINIRINDSVIYANFTNLRSRNCELRHKKTQKRQFLA